MKKRSTKTVAESSTATRSAKKVPAKARNENGISALSRGIRVLRAFRIGDSGLTNSDLAKRTNLPKPTISRITATLTELGCLNYIDHLEAYKLGGTSIAIGQIAAANFDVLQVARPLMQKFAEKTGLSLGLAALETNRMVYMDVCQGSSMIALQMKVGLRLPLFTTAMGRACLATMPTEERDRLIHKYGPKDLEERDHCQRAIERASAELDKQGYCVVVGEWYPDINAAAAPVMTDEGILILDCGGPAYTLPPARMNEEIGPGLAGVARKISENVRGVLRG